MASPQTISIRSSESLFIQTGAPQYMIREVPVTNQIMRTQMPRRGDVGAARNHVSSWSLARQAYLVELLTLDIREPSLCTSVTWVFLITFRLRGGLQRQPVYVRIFLCRRRQQDTASARGMVRIRTSSSAPVRAGYLSPPALSQHGAVPTLDTVRFSTKSSATSAAPQTTQVCGGIGQIVPSVLR